MNEVIEKQMVSEQIVSFLKGNTNFTIATSSDNVPYCANCFYAYEEENNFLVFKSDSETNHIRQALKNKAVAGSVTPDKLDRTKIQGIQFQGKFLRPENEMLDLLKKIYYKKYPFAVAFQGNIWAIELVNIKMTDNTLGFGKKIEWSARTPLEKK
jgi:hypothetical protein